MIGLVVPITAALWSILYSLNPAWENEEKSVVMVESDYEEAVNLVVNPNLSFDMVKLLCMIKNMISESWDLCELVHIPSPANIVAASLANNVISDYGGLEELSMPPAIIMSILVTERMA